MRAYEFTEQNSSNLVKRSESEQKKINDIFNEWLQKSQDIESKFNTQNNELGTWKNDFVKANEEWQKNKKDEVGNFINEGNKGLNELKKLYTEKLKLEGPVTYWHERSRKISDSW